MCQADSISISAHIEVKESDSDDVLREAAKRGTDEALRKVAEASAQHVWDEANPNERNPKISRAEFIEAEGRRAKDNASQEERDAMEEYLFLVLKRRRAKLQSRN